MFCRAVAARNRSLLTEPPFISTGSATDSPTIPPPSASAKKDIPPPRAVPKSSFGKKDQKILLKSIVRKKAGAVSASNEKGRASAHASAEPAKGNTAASTKKRTADDANHDSQRSKDGQESITSEKRQRTDSQVGSGT